MNKIQIVFIAALFALTTVSCNKQDTDGKGDAGNNSESVPGKVVMTGKFSNAAGQKIKLSYMFDVFTRKDSVLAKDSVNDQGEFSISFELSTPVFATFQCGGEYTSMYVTPGDSLNIVLDANAFDSTITYSGNGANANNYLARKQEETVGTREEIRLYHGRQEAAFVAAMDSLMDARKDFLYAFGIENTNFVELAEKKISYSYGSSMVNYESYNQYALKWKGEEEPEKLMLSEGFLTKVDGLYNADQSALNDEDYVSFVTSYIYFKMDRIEDESKYDWEKKSGYYATILGDQKVTEFMLANDLQDEVSYSGANDGNLAAFDSFKSQFDGSMYLPVIQKNLTKWDHLRKGKPAPTFAYADKEGNTIALEDLKGKYVYIDVWATWCGPCMQEAPHYQELAEDFKGKDVVFLGVSIDDDEEAWMKYLVKKKPSSTQVYANGAWASDIVKNYNIAGIPRFILIDKEGNVLEASASRPSGEIRAQLEGLLSEPS